MLSSRGRRGLSERFGCWGALPPTRLTWIHAPSVGEVQAFAPLIKQLEGQIPPESILMTSLSPTGTDQSRKLGVNCRLLPFDVPLLLRKALAKATIERFIFSETELWPNLLSYLSVRQVPIFMVNARLSKESLGRYRRAGKLFIDAVQCIDKILTQDAQSAARFEELGAKPERIMVVGNSKYDRAAAVGPEQAARLRQQRFTGDSKIITLGSVRPGEERIWIPALKRLLSERNLTAIIAPRHQEKLPLFTRALTEAGMEFSRWSDLKNGTGSVTPRTVLLLDTLGELELFYAASDLAFVGGTLLPKYKGHNLLEPALYGVPVLCGPFGRNVDAVRDELIGAGGVTLVNSAEDAYRASARLLDDSEIAAAAGQAALNIASRHRGAGQRIIKELGL